MACTCGRGKKQEAQEETEKTEARGLAFYESKILYVQNRIKSTETSLVVI